MGLIIEHLNLIVIWEDMVVTELHCHWLLITYPGWDFEALRNNFYSLGQFQTVILWGLLCCVMVPVTEYHRAPVCVRIIQHLCETSGGEINCKFGMSPMWRWHPTLLLLSLKQLDTLTRSWVSRPKSEDNSERNAVGQQLAKLWRGFSFWWHMGLLFS